MNSVTRSEVTIEDGVRVIRVGSPLLYALFWEVGHHNLFTRKHERVERWGPALRESTAEMRRIYALVVRRTLDAHEMKATG